MNISVVQRDKCTGCRLCEYVCKRGAITMIPDKDGFLYPCVNSDCVECGLCVDRCIAISNGHPTPEARAYIVQSKVSAELQNSSSGGAFRLFADKVLGEHGAVVGCVFDDDFSAKLVMAESSDEVLPMQGSKYVFSNTNNVFEKVQSVLKASNPVLFTGTPCQCKALKAFLNKEYDNLYIMDFLCHGVSSPLMLSSYIAFLEKNARGKIISLKMRDKSMSGWGEGISALIQKENGKYVSVKRIGKTDPYIYGYLSGFFNRLSCYSCAISATDSAADVTVCDYWGAPYDDELMSEIDIKKGVSGIIVRTEKGRALFNSVKDQTFCKQTTVDVIAKENPSLTHSHDGNVPPQRKSLYDELNSKGFPYIQKKYLRCKDYLVRKIYYTLKYRKNLRRKPQR